MFTDDQLSTGIPARHQASLVKRLTRYDPFASARVDFGTLSAMTSGANIKTLEQLLSLDRKDARERNLQDREKFVQRQYQVLKGNQGVNMKPSHISKGQKATANNNRNSSSSRGGGIRSSSSSSSLQASGMRTTSRGRFGTSEYEWEEKGGESSRSALYSRGSSRGGLYSRGTSREMLRSRSDFVRPMEDLDGFRTVHNLGRCALDPAQIKTKTPGPAYEFRRQRIPGGSSFGKSGSKRIEIPSSKKNRKRGRGKPLEEQDLPFGHSTINQDQFFGTPDFLVTDAQRKRREAERQRNIARAERKARRAANEEKAKKLFSKNSRPMISTAQRYTPLMCMNAENRNTIPTVRNLGGASPGPRYNTRELADRRGGRRAGFGTADRPAIFKKNDSPGPCYMPDPSGVLPHHTTTTIGGSGRGKHGGIHSFKPGAESPGPMYFPQASYESASHATYFGDPSSAALLRRRTERARATQQTLRPSSSSSSFGTGMGNSIRLNSIAKAPPNMPPHFVATVEDMRSQIWSKLREQHK